MGRVFQFHACLFHGHGCQCFRDVWLSNTIQARCECMEQDHLGVGVGTPEACRPCHSGHRRALGYSQLCTVATAWTQLPVPGSDLQVVGGPAGLMLRASQHEHSDICWEPFYTDTVSLGANSLHACLCLECKWAFFECFHKWFPSEACVMHRAEFVGTIVHLGPVLDTWISNVVRPSGWIPERRQACLGQSRVAKAWWPFAVRPTTAGTLRVGQTAQQGPAEDDQCRRPGLQSLSSCPGHHERHAGDPPLSGECLVHTQVPSIWHLHHLSGTECLSQGPQPQDHQPQCQLRHPVQEPQGHVPDLPLGQACVLWRQWHPDSCLPGHHNHACPQLHRADFNQTISPAQHPDSWWRLSWGTCPQARQLGLRRWGGQSRQRQQKRAPFIHQHALAMATATCAAEVHQHSSCRQQQHQWWPTAAAVAVPAPPSRRQR